ncbi:MAG TPA: hypothetical protein VJS12_25410 [Steroidobacteraceae bacterium]|nr:hypothetical protein [Steroidobacteraceae bacterium]
MSDKQTFSLTPKDWIGIFFSSLALIISASSYYVAHLRVAESAFARIVSIRPYSLEPMAPQNKLPVTISIAFGNTGNRPAIILNPAFTLEGDQEIALATRGADAPVSHTETLDAPPGAFPLLVAPGDLRVVDVTISAEKLASLFDVATEIPAKDNFFKIEGLRVLYGTLQYQTINSSGARQGATSEREFEVHLVREGMVYLQERNGEFSLTELLW